MTGKYSCPHCGQHVVIVDAPTGIAVKCPNCGTGFVLTTSTIRKELSKSTLVWGVLLTLTVVIPTTILLVNRFGTEKRKPVAAKPNQALSPSLGSKGESGSGPRATAAATPETGPMLQNRPLSAWVDGLDVNLEESPAMQHARDTLRQAGQAIVPDLVAMLNDPNEDSRRRGNVARALGYAGRKDGPEVQRLLGALHDDNTYVRYSSIYSLRTLGLDPNVLVPLFKGMLADPDTAVRRSAAANLGLIGAPARETIPEIEKLLDDELKMTRDRAEEAIKRIKAAVARDAAGSQAAPKRGPLIENRPLSDWVDRMDINLPDDASLQHAQGVLHEAGSEIVPDLIAMLGDLKGDARRRGNSARALGYAGRKDGPEFDLLWKALGDEQSYVRYSACYSVRRLRGDPQRLVPKFVEMLADPDGLVRRGAAGNLGNMGLAALPAIPDLEKLLVDEEQKNRDSAALAIRKIKFAQRATQKEGAPDADAPPAKGEK